MNDNIRIQPGQYWKLKTNSHYTVLIERVIFGIVFFKRFDATAFLKKKKFFERFTYSHYSPTHQEMQ